MDSEDKRYKPSDGPPVEIPDVLVQRLQGLGARFVRVAKRDKNPVDIAWQKPENLMYADDSQLQTWLKEGGNYGIAAGYGLAILNADHEEIKQVVESKFPPSFTVESPGHKAPVYFFLSNLTRKMFLRTKNGECAGEILWEGFQTVGPGSIHPKGGVYKIINDALLATIPKDQLATLLGDHLVPEKQIVQSEETARKERQDSNVDLSILQVVPLAGLRKQGDEYYGPHPVHGSETGRNFWVNPAKNVWHCFRHDTGGGPLLWLAVEEGIIDCSQAGAGALRGDLFKKVLQKAAGRGLAKQTRINVKKQEEGVHLGDYRLELKGSNVVFFDKNGDERLSYPIASISGVQTKNRIAKKLGVEEDLVDRAIAKFVSALEQPKQIGLTEKEQAPIELVEKALSLLKDPKSLCTLELSFREQGLVGETKNAFATFFDMLSTLTRNPINKRWSGRSGLGKTAIVTKVAAVFPPERLIIRAGLTKKAVWHMPDGEDIDERTRALDLKGKVLVLLEESGSREFLDDAKPLLSHDLPELKYEFTEKTAEGLTTFVQVLRGWPTYIGITTIPELREEQQTRALIGSPDRGERKYRSVIAADASKAALPWETPRTEHTAIVQEAIRQLQPHKVWTPWLPIVAEAFPSKEAKSMREWSFFRSLLESLTLWFQYTLPHVKFNGEEYVCAPPFILELGLLIAEAAFRETITGLEKDVADFIEYLRNHGPGPWTYQQLLKEHRDCFGESISKGTLQRRYTQKLVDLGLLDIDDSKKPYRLSLGDEPSPTSRILGNSLEKVKSDETKHVLASTTSCMGKGEYASSRPVLPNGTTVSWEQFWNYLYSLELVHDVKELFTRSKEQEYHELGISADLHHVDDDFSEKKAAITAEEPPPETTLKLEEVHKPARLTSNVQGENVSCGMKGRMDWQVTKHDGNWVLLCGDCGCQLQKRLEGSTCG